jgi:hypothetical protein
VKVGDVVTRIVNSNQASLDWAKGAGIIVEVSPALYMNDEVFYRVVWQDNASSSSWYKEFQIATISHA